MRPLRIVVKAVAVIIGIAVLGAGVPLAWFWIGGKLGGDFTPGEYLSPQTFVAIIPGMLITYLVLLDIFATIWRRGLSDQQQRDRAWPVRRASWNRSMRDEAHRPGDQRLSAIEFTFVGAATVMIVAFNIWFFFYAESPL